MRHSLLSKKLFAAGLTVATLTAAFVPKLSWACACGCGVFEIGTNSMFPSGQGGMFFLENDYMDQNKNWHGTSQANSSDNSDQQIRTNFFKAGAQYMVNRSWGVQLEVPYWSRYFRTTTTDSNGNTIITPYNHSSLGDIRLTGLYTGFSDDLSTGLIFGVKLPTGNWNDSGFDRDTQIGTGSTDLLLGFYHLGSLAMDGNLAWLGQINLDQPIFTQGGYQPGNEIDAALGIFYQGFNVNASSKIVPILEAIASVRGNDNGQLPTSSGGADEFQSGYQRLLAAPGLEADISRYRIFADVELPFYQNVNGDQLVSSIMYKLSLSVGF
jgi:hypothetical protein